SRIGFPGEVELVSATVAGIAFAGDAAFVTAQFERRQARGFADLFGGNLVHGNTGLDVRAFRFAGLAAGEKRGRGAGVVAGAVAGGAGLVVRETADDLEIVLEWRQRLEDVWNLVIRNHTHRGEVFHVRHLPYV